MDKCQVEGCNREVSKAGHTLCYDHWRDEQDGIITPCEACGKYKDNDYPLCKACYNKAKSGKEVPHEEDFEDDKGKGKTLSATAIAKELGTSNQKINQILAELGWIKKTDRGYFPTRLGRDYGAQHKEHFQSGSAYVVWDKSILNNKMLINAVKEYKGEIETPQPDAEKKADDKFAAFRKDFPADKRATDGHLVRSRGELLIDNFLYTNKIVHAYERRLPIEEECYCDFYLPDKGIYIEYWGLEEDKKYQERKKEKLRIYNEHKFKLIEIKNEHIDNLDDYLPRQLKLMGITIS